MAPQTSFDADTVAKMLDIQRTVWLEATGIEIRPGALPPTNGRPNKNPKSGSFDGPLPRPFKLADGEETTRFFISDPWPSKSWAEADADERERRVEGGRSTSYTKKHWTRPERRRKNRIARAARKLNARRGRKVIA